MIEMNIVTKLDIIQMQLDFYNYLLKNDSLNMCINGEPSLEYIEKLTKLTYWQDLYDKELDKH